MPSKSPRRRTITDEPEYALFMARIVRNMLKRAEDHSMDTLRSLVTVQKLLDETTYEMVTYLRSEEGGSHSWAQIGGVLGISRQAAQVKFGGSGARKPGGQPANLR
jgi:hypothetical protein